MAKRKSKSGVRKICLLLAALLGVVAMCMIFLPAIKSGDIAHNGLRVVFGYSEKVDLLISTTKVEVLKFSILNMVTYLLTISAVVLSLVGLNSKSKMLGLLNAALFIGAAVFFFLTPQFVVFASTLLAEYVEWTLAIGSIIGGCLTAVAGLSSLYSIVAK